jgi:hypothetical protein
MGTMQEANYSLLSNSDVKNVWYFTVMSSICFHCMIVGHKDGFKFLPIYQIIHTYCSSSFP